MKEIFSLIIISLPKLLFKNNNNKINKNVINNVLFRLRCQVIFTCDEEEVNILLRRIVISPFLIIDIYFITNN